MIGKHTERLFQNEVFNISLDNSVTSQQDQVLTCHAVLQTECETRECNRLDPLAYAISHELNDPYTVPVKMDNKD